MYSISTLLAPFPAVLTSHDLALALGFSTEAIDQICSDRHLCATRVDGQWMIGKSELIAQLTSLRTPAVREVVAA